MGEQKLGVHLSRKKSYYGKEYQSTRVASLQLAHFLSRIFYDRKRYSILTFGTQLTGVRKILLQKFVEKEDRISESRVVRTTSNVRVLHQEVRIMFLARVVEQRHEKQNA